MDAFPLQMITITAVVTGAAIVGAALTPTQGPSSDAPRIFRVILPVGDIERAAQFYTELMGIEGERVSPGRHYFHTGDVILAVVDPRADGDERDPRPNQDHIYLAVRNLEPFHARAAQLGGLSNEMGAIDERPWGELSFYMEDPFGNPLCFVDETTLFTGQRP